jgi:hypothetical protein
MNRGLSEELKLAFPSLKKFVRPVTTGQTIESPYLISGFTSGEGHFGIVLGKLVNEYKYSSLKFNVSQHIRDEFLMKSFVSYFDSGHFRDQSEISMCSYECNKFSDIANKIIPFFTKYPIAGTKLLDFLD